LFVCLFFFKEAQTGSDVLNFELDHNVHQTHRLLMDAQILSEIIIIEKHSILFSLLSFNPFYKETRSRRSRSISKVQDIYGSYVLPIVFT